MKKRGQKTFNNENVHRIKMLGLPLYPLHSPWLQDIFHQRGIVIDSSPASKSSAQMSHFSEFVQASKTFSGCVTRNASAAHNNEAQGLGNYWSKTLEESLWPAGRKRFISWACGITPMKPIAQLWQDLKKVHCACRCFFEFSITSVPPFYFYISRRDFVFRIKSTK